MHVGEIRLLAGNYEPDGWAWCDGRMLDPKQYPDLFGKNWRPVLTHTRLL